MKTASFGVEDVTISSVVVEVFAFDHWGVGRSSVHNRKSNHQGSSIACKIASMVPEIFKEYWRLSMHALNSDQPVKYFSRQLSGRRWITCFLSFCVECLRVKLFWELGHIFRIDAELVNATNQNSWFKLLARYVVECCWIPTMSVSDNVNWSSCVHCFSWKQEDASAEPQKL